MIEARSSKCAHALIHWYIRRIASADFADLRLLGETPSIDPNRPLVVTPNHSSWWDGFWCYLLNRATHRRPTYFLMLEKELSKYPYFSRVGCFSIRPESAKSILTTFRYIEALLAKEPQSVLYYFPQGELRPDVAGTLELKRGIERLKLPDDTAIQPTVFRVEYLSSRKPTVFCLADRTFSFRELCDRQVLLQEELKAQRTRLHELIRTGARGRSILRGDGT